MRQKKRQRVLALGVFGAFGISVIGALASVSRPSEELPAPPPLLPAAHANPAEVGYQDTLHAGETLSELLSRAELAGTEAGALLHELTEYQDPRSLRPGSVIAYRKSFVNGEVRGMELRLDADRTLNMERKGADWRGTVDEVPVRRERVILAGAVKSSLYAALLDGEGDVPSEERERVADLLADRIFAWQVDFSRDLRPGDRFRVLYDRMVRPDGTARSGEVVAVQFKINGKDHEAYRFGMGDRVDYYQRDGESMKRAFLRAPLEFRRISSAFSYSRFHPILKKSRPHLGIDYSASSGTPVRAVGDAVVLKAGWGGGYGNVVELRHSRGYVTRYAHLKAFARGLRPGARVEQGELIGYVGTTGLSTAPHLHYEFRQNGKAVNPNSVKYLTGEPVPRRYLSRFRSEVERYLAAMDAKSEVVLLADED